MTTMAIMALFIPIMKVIQWCSNRMNLSIVDFQLKLLQCNSRNHDSSRINLICMCISFKRYVDQLTPGMDFSAPQPTTVPSGRSVAAEFVPFLDIGLCARNRHV
jgi:hypothetical protein